MNEIISPPAIVRPAEELANLAKQINAENQKVETTLRAGLEHARKAGELLNKAKASLPHGQWLPWLKENCQVAERTAQTYMALANRWDELETKCATVADLTFREASKLLIERSTVEIIENIKKAQAISDSRGWEAADCFAELRKREWCVGRIAKECGSSAGVVRLFLRIAKRYPDKANRPFFDDAAAEASPPIQEAD